MLVSVIARAVIFRPTLAGGAKNKSAPRNDEIGERTCYFQKT